MIFLLTTVLILGLFTSSTLGAIVSIGEAVDNTSLTYLTGGPASWYGQTDSYFYDGDSVQSGDIADGQTSWFSFKTASVSSGGIYVKFIWKVSCEERGDMLNFYIDSNRVDAIDGEVDWQTEAHYVPEGVHTLEWRYEKDMGISEGADAGWVDHVELISSWSIPVIGEAVDNTDLTWSSFFSGYGAAWKGEPFIQVYGGDAAQSGPIKDSSSSYVDTGVTGPGTVKFYWKVSSELGDYLTFYIDGVPQSSINGDIDWHQRTFPVTSGYHTLRWSYQKDVGVSGRSDAGWLDKVEFTSTPPPTATPTPTPSPSPSPTPTATPTPSPTPSPSPSPSPNPTATPTPTPTPTASPTPTPSPSPSLAATATPPPTATPTPTPSSSPSPTPIATPTPTPITTPTVKPTSTPKPNTLPTSDPTPMPTATVTGNPTSAPVTYFTSEIVITIAVTIIAATIAITGLILKRKKD